jgi:choline-sulfatase
MAKRPPNVVLIVSDEHQRDMTGCYGHAEVETPNLDRLAERGVTFDSAYCNSPLCVPSRASFATGRYIHQIGTWDNGAPIGSDVETLGHVLGGVGYQTIVCGKMHWVGDDQLHGLDERRTPEPHGTTISAPEREHIEPKPGNRGRISEAGVGDRGPVSMDRPAHSAVLKTLDEKEKNAPDQPWLLVASYVSPHFPLLVPEPYFSRYFPNRVRPPVIPDGHLNRLHPASQLVRRHFDLDNPPTEEEVLRCRGAYLGLIDYFDDMVGEVVEKVESSSFADDTVIIYTSDHGEMAGAHGMWWKCSMYEESVAVPWIISWPVELPQNERVRETVTLVDLLPTIADLVGAQLPSGLPGQSVLRLIGGAAEERVGFSEYHAHGTTGAMYMIRKGALKYIHHQGYESHVLYDLPNDPGEFNNLAGAPEMASLLDDLHTELLAVVDPEKTDAVAKADQAKRRRESAG